MSAASIPLSFHPTVQAEPTDEIALRAGQIQAQRQNMLLGQAQLQGVQQQNQQRQMDLDAQQLIHKAMVDAAQPEQQRPSTPSPSVAAGGSSPAAPPATVVPPDTAIPSSIGDDGGHGGVQPDAQDLVDSNRGNTLAAGMGVAPASPRPAAPQTPPPPPQRSYNDRVIDNLNKSAPWLVPGIRSQMADSAIKVAKMYGDEADNRAKYSNQVAQSLQGIQDNPSLDQAGKDALFQQTRNSPAFQQAWIQAGNDPRAIPPKWDDNQMTQLIGQGSTLAVHNSRIEQAAKRTADYLSGLPKNADEVRNQVQKEIANIDPNAPDPNQEYQNILTSFRALGNQEQKLAPDKPSLYNTVLSTYPATWNRGVTDQATLGSMPAQDRIPYLQKSLELTNQKMTAAALKGQDAYDAAKARLDPTEAAIYPDQADPDKVRQVGLTASQAQMGDFRGQQITLQEQRNQIMQQRLDAIESQQKAQTAQQHRTNISQLADQAVSDSVSNGGRGIDDARKNLDPKYNYYQGTPIGDSRGEVDQELERRQKNAALTKKAENADGSGGAWTISSAGAWRKSHPGQPLPAKPPDESQPAASAQPAVKPVAPAVQAKPAVTPPTASAKTFPRARLAGFAQKNRMTSEQAETELKAQGYSVQ